MPSEIFGMCASLGKKMANDLGVMISVDAAGLPSEASAKEGDSNNVKSF